MNRTLLINNGFNYNLSFTLEQVWKEVQELLGSFTNDSNFVTSLNLAFGEEIDVVKAMNLIRAWANKDYSNLPKIEIRDSVEIKGANGAYAAANNTIYLSREFLNLNANKIEVITKVVVEELGHAIDWQSNIKDAPGDEGAIFASLVEGSPLEQSDLNQFRLENDTTTTVIDGQALSLEQDTDIFLTLQNTELEYPGKPTGIYVDEQENVYITYNVIVEEAFTISQHTVLAKYSPDGFFVNWVSAPYTTNFKYTSLPNSREFLALRKDGAIFTVNPDTLQFSNYFDMKAVEIDNSSVYDITNDTPDTTRVIQPQFSEYNDIAARQNGSTTEIFVTGQGGSAGIMPFVARIRIDNNTITEATVLINGVRAQVGGSASFPASGIAVNSQGEVLTTFPVLLPGRETTSIHLVKFDADFDPEQGRNNISFLDDGFFSFGMTSDSQGNFYILRDGQLGQSSVAVLPPNTNQYSYVEELGAASIDGGSVSTGDVAVAPMSNQAYVTFNNSVLTFPVNSTISSLELTGGTAQIAYVAYYGRPADNGGLTFWNNALTENNVSYAPRRGDSLTGQERVIYDDIVNQFGNSPEADRLFGSIEGNRNKVNRVYQFAFNRDGDAAGLDFWTDQIDRGNVTLSTFAMEIALGAQNEDIVTLYNKIESADLFSESINTEAERNAYSGSSGEIFGRDWLDDFGDTVSSQAQVDSALDDLVNG